MTGRPAVNSKLRIGGILFAGYFALAGLEALWIGVGARWFVSARTWAAMHPPYTLPRLLAACVVGLAVAWAVHRGHRWAWYAAVTWAGMVSAGSAVFVAAVALGLRATAAGGSPANLATSLVVGHPVEATAGAIQLACGVASFAYLLHREARDFIFRLDQHGRP